MISNTQIDRKLDDFLKGAVAYNELESFFTSNEVTNTGELLAEHKTAIAVVQHYNLAKQVQLVHQQFINAAKTATQPQEAKVVRMSPVKMMMRIAAAVVILLASLTAVQYFTSTGSSFYYNLNEGYIVNNTRDGQQASAIIEAYQSGNYKRTIELFEQINNPGNRELFITANSLMQLNNTTRSIELYQQILNNNKTAAQKFYQDEAEYYLAMAYLKNNETDKALPILTQIADDKNHTYHDKIDKWTLFKMKWFGH